MHFQTTSCYVHQYWLNNIYAPRQEDWADILVRIELCGLWCGLDSITLNCVGYGGQDQIVLAMVWAILHYTRSSLWIP